MTADELCRKLRIDETRLAAFLAEGLPHTGRGKSRRFEDTLVLEWLYRQGYVADNVAPKKPITLRTIGEVAKHYNVAGKTIEKYLQQGMPGKPGPRGKQDGYFLVAEMDAWIAEREKRNGTNESAQHEKEKLYRVKRRLAEIQLAEKQRSVVPVALVGSAYVRAIHEAQSLLKQLPGSIAKQLPSGSSPQLKRQVRDRVERVLDSALRALAETQTHQAADLENIPSPDKASS